MDTLTAILLLSGIPGTPEPQPKEAEYYVIREHVQRVAVAWEIMDEREKSYIFAKPSEFQQDLDMLRRRNVELRDAPRVCEADKLPPREWVSQLCTFNRGYRSYLDNRRDLEQDREDVLSAAICETDAAYRVYDLVRDSKADFYYVVVRRQALQRLRDRLTEEEWAAVRLPPPVPVWRFQEGD